MMKKLHPLLTFIKKTPLHPQWLLGKRKAPEGIQNIAGSLLDIGAADRWLEKELSSTVKYIALDHSTIGIELYGSQPDIIADATNLPFSDDFFDNIACLEVLEHVPDPQQAVNEIYRALKPGGRVWISMPFLYPIHDAPFDFQRYSKFGLQSIALNSGFKIISIKPRLHTIKTVGLLVCLAMIGGIHEKKGFSLILLPFALAMIVIVNILSWIFSYFWPNWGNITQGYEMVLEK